MREDIRKNRGRGARRPLEIPFSGWIDIGRRVVREVSDDRVPLVAAGGAFFMLLALFPGLTAFVSLYGFVSDPQTIADHIALLGGLLPSGGVDLIEAQLKSLVSQDPSALSLGFIAGLATALWSTNSGIKTLFAAMNVAYNEREKRGFFRLNFISFGFTLAALAIGMLFIVSVGVVPAVLAFAGLGHLTEFLVSVLRWPVMFVACWAAIAVVYRYGPSRRRAEWRWIMVGSLLATAVWIGMSILFSWYLTNFADYDKTYGSLGAVIGLMMWTWISLTILVLGAELNSEIEHQVQPDSTIGPDRPMGHRGFVVADTLGKRYDQVGEADSADALEDKGLAGASKPARDGDADPNDDGVASRAR